MQRLVNLNLIASDLDTEFKFIFRSSGTDIGHRILSTMKSIQFDLELMRLQEKDLPPPDGLDYFI